MRWLPPLGFQNTYAIAVRRETAGSIGLSTLSDLARVSTHLRARAHARLHRPSRWAARPREAPTGSEFRAVRALLPAVKYQALAAGEVDVIDGYSTDGLIAEYDLVVLEDDRRFFPPYEAAALIGSGLAERASGRRRRALTELSGLLTGDRHARLNRRVEVDGEPVARVAADALAELGLTAARRRRVRRRRVVSGEGRCRRYLWDRAGAFSAA